MDQLTARITASALLHDVGKVVDLHILGKDRNWAEDQAADCLPTKDGRYSHWHALFTREILDRNLNNFPEGLIHGEEGVLLLAARHHSPSTALEWIIAKADHISSAMDREKYGKDTEDPGWQKYREVRMVPLLEKLNPEAADKGGSLNASDFTYRYRLAPLSPATLPPVPSGERKTGSYETLAQDFEHAFAALPHKEHTGLWLQHLDSLLMRFFSQVPAARAGKVIPDVSLYDHLKTTAAFAAALYQYHRDTQTLSAAAIQNDDAEKFLLISGDFNGIQSWIFRDGGATRKFRSKLLRGRSFQVSLMTDLVGHRLCDAMGLSSVNLLLKAGGKFTLVAPNTPNTLKIVEDIKNEIADWFLDKTHGEAGMSITLFPAGPKAFQEGRLAGLWESMHRKMADEKFCRIAMENNTGKRPVKAGEKGFCPICGQRPVEVKHRETDCCTICRDQIWMGEQLVKNRGIRISGNMKGELKSPLLGRYQVSMEASPESISATSDDILIWQFDLPEKPESPQVTLRFVNGYVPVFSEEDEFLADWNDEEPVKAGDPKHFSAIADAAQSPLGEKGACVSALAVLKADVDHLGMLFACGFSEGRYTISRLATLSRQLDMFFSLLLPDILRKTPEFQDVYTVFAGGDDLFLIGPWRQVLTLAERLQKDFSSYVSHNPKVHFSCGIVLEKPHTPVDYLVERAEHSLENAKNAGRNRISIFDRVLEWKDLNELNELRRAMAGWVHDEKMSSGMLYRMGAFVDMAEEEKELTGKHVPIEKMSCLRWRSLLAYAVARNVKEGAVKEVHERMAEALLKFRGDFRVPLWTLLYERRRRRS
ncbi:CRISPR-associated protein Csm1 [Desulfobotulus alkaliphilus]|uniref:CRISPR system single-strand-specific deoxyribonuclease Cas10/Csm1 (subtype III-A) n=1 Tax=Desulfobotulus alkaliphilus TaxID=622671 RepID=A0A562R6Y1_9BACT|nr:type III-A CRISPR-associated protein Cas10/Csm1 [Desulfobotulus alkaliphilus]TWI64807.1 CRISPR-associated protein Csm1 [Desulfobotulus alkaliphilus]